MEYLLLILFAIINKNLLIILNYFKNYFKEFIFVK